MVAIKKYIPNFLLPTDEPQTPGRIYDVPPRHHLFHRSEAGNETTVSESRNNSVASQDAEQRRSSAASQERRESWHPGMAFQGLKDRLHL
ncbi:hypothetical protein PV04_03543 [Phialophora macrospora]|uniref:Uncharacterized protein n=1 Tax=Phialophora macrospora TaxID=1851006 RepID=A0A0D2EAM8_9EURO|nr:hypothetical protein PV04_03543 [Phialophora macrospora]